MNIKKLLIVGCVELLVCASACVKADSLGQSVPVAPKISADVATEPNEIVPLYYVIPIKGEIGIEVQAAFLKPALDDAQIQKAKIVALQIDSPGGRLDDMLAIMKLIRSYPQLRIVAVVEHTAGSASALIALTCQEIYMTPGSRIGAATPVVTNGVFTSSLSKRVETIAKEDPELAAKIKANVEAQDRAINELVKYREFARAMKNSDYELYMVIKGNSILLSEQSMPGAKQIKKRGEVLMLTTEEAAGYGLAMQVPESDKLMPFLGFDKFRATDISVQRRIILQGKYARRDYLIKLNGPKLQPINQRIDEIKADIAADNGKLNTLKQQYNADVAKIEDVYKSDMNAAGAWDSIAFRKGAYASAKRHRQMSMDRIDSEYRKKIEPIQEELNLLNQDLKRFQDQKNEIMDDIMRQSGLKV